MAKTPIEVLESAKNHALNQIDFSEKQIEYLENEISQHVDVIANANTVLGQMGLAIRVLERELAE